MRYFTIQDTFTEDFWDQYMDLWLNSCHKSSFQGPEILKYFSNLYAGHTKALLLWQEQKLIAALFLKKENGTFTFLSDLKSDANWFIFHKNATGEDFDYFFNTIFKTIKEHNWRIILNKIPGWVQLMNNLESAGTNSKLFWQNLKYTVCPVIEASTPEILFSTINRSRQFRYAVNRLNKQYNATFEIFHDDEDLENWVKEFCQTHIKRWQNTATPSAYRDLKMQLFLLDSLRAWNKDKVLMRVSVKVNEKRIGFSINLKEGNSLIGHSTTYDPAFKKFSPGKSLIYIMAQWMKENNITLFDFGNGDEEYKYSLANKDHTLHRIFISGKGNIPFILKAKIIKMIRNENELYRFYKKKVKSLLIKIRPEKKQSLVLKYDEVEKETPLEKAV